MYILKHRLISVSHWCHNLDWSFAIKKLKMAEAWPIPQALFLLIVSVVGLDTCPSPCTCSDGPGAAQLLDCNGKRLTSAALEAPAWIIHAWVIEDMLFTLPDGHPPAGLHMCTTLTHHWQLFHFYFLFSKYSIYFLFIKFCVVALVFTIGIFGYTNNNICTNINGV